MSRAAPEFTKEQLDALKAGDEVAVYDYYERKPAYLAKVTRRTKTQILVTHESDTAGKYPYRFRSDDGFEHGRGVFASRCLGPRPSAEG